MSRIPTLLIVLLVSLVGVRPLAARVAAQQATPVNPTASPTAAMPANLAVVLSGLTNPRGFTWGGDGTLYLAQAGNGGDTHIAAAPGFTVDLGLSSSVIKLANDCIAPVAQGLVSTRWDEPGWVWGAMDVAILDGQLYVLASGAGPSWLSPTSRSGVFRANADGTMTLVADLTTWLPQHPPRFIAPDYDADGSQFDLEPAGNALLLSDAVTGLILRVTPNGDISTLADLSPGHPVPTGLAVDAAGNVYVGFQTAAPFVDGSAKVVRIAPDGTITDVWTGLTRLGGVALGSDGSLYAAEVSTGNTASAPFAHPGTGRIVHQTGPASMETVVAGLDFPIGLGFGPDGALYVSGPASGADGGQGWLARVGTAGARATAGTPGPCPPAPAASPAA